MEMICINCPLGCIMEVTVENGDIKVKGNTCNKGKKYAIEEWTHPVRTVTTSLYVEDGVRPLISVKTNAPFPKEKIFELIDVLKKMTLKAPVQIGDVILKDALATGINVVATQNCAKK